MPDYLENADTEILRSFQLTKYANEHIYLFLKYSWAGWVFFPLLLKKKREMLVKYPNVIRIVRGSKEPLVPMFIGRRALQLPGILFYVTSHCL